MARPKGSFKTKLDEQQLKELETMAAIGLPYHHISAIFGFSKSAFEDLIVRDQQVKEVLLKGRAKAAAKAYRTAYQMAVEERNPTMLIFWLKTREGWKESELASERIDLSDCKD